MRTPCAICSRSKSTAWSSCRRTKRSSTSTTSRAACRYRRRSSSSTSVPRGKSRCAPSADPTRARAVRATSRRPGTQLSHVRGLPLGTRGGFVATHLFPSDGEYEVNIADMFSHIWGNDSEFENTVVVTLDNKIVYETTLGGEEDTRLYDQVQNGAMEKINARLKDIRFVATAGPHKVGVTFRRRTFAESDDQQQMFVPGGGQDRVFRVSSFEVSGPYNPTGLSATPSRERIFVCHPSRGDDRRALRRAHPERARDARVSSAARRRGSAGPARVLSRRLRPERLRGGHPQRHHWHPRRARTSSTASRCRRRTSRPGETYALDDVDASLEAIVLPLEHDPRRRAARPRRARPARRRTRAARPSRAHAEGPARRDARQQLRLPLARSETSGRGRARHVDLSVRVGSRAIRAGITSRSSSCSRRASSTRIAASRSS